MQHIHVSYIFKLVHNIALAAILYFFTAFYLSESLMAVSLLPYCLFFLAHKFIHLLVGFFLAGTHALEELEKITVEGIKVTFTPIFVIQWNHDHSPLIWHNPLQ